MAAIFNTAGYTCAPATITYDDDDQLINVVMNLGKKGTFTFKTDHTPSGNLIPFAGQIFYNDLENMELGEGRDYNLRTGGKYAVVTIGNSDQPTNAVAVAYNERIVPKTSDEGVGDWSLAKPKSAEPRRPRPPPSSTGEEY